MNNPTNQYHIIRMPEGSGKINAELRRVTHPAEDQHAAPSGSIIFLVSRKEIEACKTDRFLATFGPSVPSMELKRMRGNVVFTVEGYDDHPDELYEIPEIRKFISQLNTRWGAWFFFAQLQSSSLKWIACCLANNLNATRQQGNPLHDVSVRRDELDAWGCYCTAGAVLLDNKIGISPRRGSARIRQIERYFGFK